MKNIKTALYIHGYGSKGYTGIFLSSFLKEYDIKILHPKIPESYEEAKSFVKYFIENYKVDLIIGSSLGGYITLDSKINCLKIVINPCIKPYEKLIELGVNKDIALSYPVLRTTNKYDKNFTFGIFGGKDEILDYKDEFSMMYNHNNMFFVPDGKHSLTNEQLKDVLPLVLEKAHKSIDEFNFMHTLK